MNNTKLYNEIFRRRSIRRYIDEQFTTEKLSAIKEDFENFVTPLIPDIKYQYLFINSENVKNMLPIPRKAPHYICFFSENKEGFLQNAGYIMEQFSLILSSKNIGTCYMGASKILDVPVPEGMEYVMLMAFGESKKPIYRDYEKFKRKKINEITNITENISDIPITKLFETVRLAPSAKNEQNYFFTKLNDDYITLLAKPDKVKKFNPEFDCGVALYHLNSSAQKYGLNMDFTLNNKLLDDENKYKFIGNIKLY